MPIEDGVLIAHLLLRGDTAAALLAADPVLKDREVCMETDSYTVAGGRRVYKFKVGPGQWSVLPYGAMGESGLTEADVDALITAHSAAPDPHGDRAYADGLVATEATARDAAISAAAVGLWDDRGNFDASAAAYPTTGGSGAAGSILKGDIWTVSVAGNGLDKGDTVRALVDSPGTTAANWAAGEANVQQATESQRGTAKVVGQPTIEDSASTNDTDLVTPKKWWQGWFAGLTLPAFQAAARNSPMGVAESGLSGTWTATDSIVYAMRKLSNRFGSTLLKSNNLSDLSNINTARNNLGLKDYALQDYAEALVRRTIVTADTSPNPEVGSVVVYSGGKYYAATPGNVAGQRVGIVAAVESGKLRVQLGGIINLPSLSLTDGSDYYLDPDTPGGLVSTRPAANPLYIGTCLGGTLLDFRPSLIVRSGQAVLNDDAETTDYLGLPTALQTPTLYAGAYEVKVYAQVSADSGAGRALLWLKGASITARGTLAYAKDGSVPASDPTLVVADITAPDQSPGTMVTGANIECHLSALVTLGTKSAVMVVLAPLNNEGSSVYLRAGSVITWRQIGS